MAPRPPIQSRLVEAREGQREAWHAGFARLGLMVADSRGVEDVDALVEQRRADSMYRSKSLA